MLTRSTSSIERCVAGSKCPDRLDRVAGEVEPERLGASGREDVDDAAADAELAVGIDRVLAREAGVDQQRRQRVGIDFVAGLHLPRGRQQPVGRAELGQQGRAPTRRSLARRRSPRREAPRLARTAHRDAGPGRGTDRLRARGTATRRGWRPTSDNPSRTPRKKRTSPVVCSTSASVGTTATIVAPGGPGQRQRRLPIRRGRQVQGPRGRRKTRYARRAGRAEVGVRDGALEQGLEGQGCGHRWWCSGQPAPACRIFSIILVVENPGRERRFG